MWWAELFAWHPLQKSERFNPVLDGNGKPVIVVKFATDITQKKLRSLADASRIAAIERSQAVIEFKLDGTILTANANFLNVMGYSLAENKRIGKGGREIYIQASYNPILDLNGKLAVSAATIASAGLSDGNDLFVFRA